MVDFFISIPKVSYMKDMLKMDSNMVKENIVILYKAKDILEDSQGIKNQDSECLLISQKSKHKYSEKGILSS